jgi:hypothetical protein
VNEDTIEVKRVDKMFVVSKICQHVNSAQPHKYAHVAYSRAELEQLVVEAKKILEEK